MTTCLSTDLVSLSLRPIDVLCALISGSAGVLVGHPLDTIKVCRRLKFVMTTDVSDFDQS